MTRRLGNFDGNDERPATGSKPLRGVFAGKMFGGRVFARRSFARKSFAFFLFSACIPGLIVGFSVFLVNRELVQHDLQQIHQKQLDQTAKSIDDVFSNLELSVAHFAFDPSFGNTLRNLDFVYGYKEIDNLYRTLLIMQGTNPLIDHVELYVDDSQPYLFTDDQYRILTPAQARPYQQTMSAPNGIFWRKSLAGIAPGYDFGHSLELVLRVPGGSLNAFGSLVVFLNRDKLKLLLNTLTPYAGGSTFVFSSDNGWILTDTADQQPTALEESLRLMVDGSSKPARSFLFRWKGTAYSVSSGTFSRLHDSWHYVSAAPLAGVAEPVINLSKIIILVSVVGLVMALMLSWFSSQRLYRPLERLIHTFMGTRSNPSLDGASDEFVWIEKHWSDLARNSERLQERVEQQMHHARQGFLLQLAQGYLYALSEEELYDRMNNYGWDVTDGTVRALMVQIGSVAGADGRRGATGDTPVTFAAANLLEELAAGFPGVFEVIHFHDLSMGALTIAAPGQNEAHAAERLEPLCRAFAEAVNRVLHLRVTITISRSSGRLRDVPYLFEQADVGLGYRNPERQNEIIKLDERHFGNRKHPFTYPYTLEREIIHTIRMGQRNDAVLLIEDFVEELFASSEMEGSVHQGMLYLLGSIHHVILESGLNPYHIYEGTNLYEKVLQVKDVRSLPEWFGANVIQPFLENLEEREHMQSRRMVMQMIDHLAEHYMEPVSLNFYADMLGTSVYDISRSFKLVTGTNFVDYVTNLKIGKAKQFLASGSLMVSEIAEKIGYQSSYFNRLFKKHEGISPGKYRERNSKT